MPYENWIRRAEVYMDVLNNIYTFNGELKDKK